MERRFCLASEETKKCLHHPARNLFLSFTNQRQDAAVDRTGKVASDDELVILPMQNGAGRSEVEFVTQRTDEHGGDREKKRILQRDQIGLRGFLRREKLKPQSS